MRSLVIAEPRHAAIVETPLAEPVGDELLIRVRASGICGTDVHIFKGEFADGYPIIPGHEFAGEVVAVGPDCTRFAPGARVAVEPNIPCNNCPECLAGDHHFCRNMIVPGVNRPGGMAEYTVVAERAAFDIGDLPFVEGALCEPLSCCIHAVDRLGVGWGERVLVMGAGPISLMIGRLIKARGAGRVDFLARNGARARRIAALGLGSVYASLAEIEDRSYPSIVDATGAPELVAEAAERVARPRGRVLLFGVPSAHARVSFDHFQVFRQEVSLISSFTSLKNSQQAIELMRSGTLSLSDLITHRIKLSEASEYLSRMAAGGVDYGKVTVTDFAG